MHPAFYYWWKHGRGRGEGHDHEGAHAHERHAGPCADGAEHGARHHGEHHGHGHGPFAWANRFGGGPGGHGPGGEDGGGFGVRRPLRFLANRLELDEDQVATLARILNELKTERAQAEVDQQRTVTAFADAIEGPAFDEARAEEGGKLRVASAERLKAAVQKALVAIHALLTKEQRQKFAYLVRTGVVSM